MNTKTFICELTEEQQQVVRQKIEEVLNKDYPRPMGVIQTEVANAMDGRLCDLEDNIDVDVLMEELEEMCERADDNYKENPHACVHCGKVTQLNKCAVCKDCWDNSRAGEYKDWEDTL